MASYWYSKIFKIIFKGYDEDEMTPECQDLIKQFLDENYEQRLGYDGV